MNGRPKIGLQILDVYKSFGATQALKGVSFEVHPGEVVAVLGPSGCGKSTLLSLVAGLESPDRGDIRWEGVSLLDTPSYRRGFGLMFQDFALFPHRNVDANVAFGLEMAHLPKAEREARVQEVLSLVNLPGFGLRDVNTLSGGEQQRVALARSLAPRPRLLMLDEPLGALDRTLRERLIVDLGEILRRSHQTAVYVTHDQEEAFSLADRVVVMNAGRVEQTGPPQKIYTHPESVFVARFLGFENLLPGKISCLGQSCQVSTPAGIWTLPGPVASGEVTVLLRPDAVRLGSGGPSRLEATLLQTTFRGSTCRASVKAGEAVLAFNFPSTTGLPAPGEILHLSFDPAEALQFWPSSY